MHTYRHIHTYIACRPRLKGIPYIHTYNIHTYIHTYITYRPRLNVSSCYPRSYPHAHVLVTTSNRSKSCIERVPNSDMKLKFWRTMIRFRPDFPFCDWPKSTLPSLSPVPGEPFLFQRGGSLHFGNFRCVSNHPDFLLIGQACRAAQPPPIFELVRNTLHHGDTIETRVWGPSVSKRNLLLVKMKEKNLPYVQNRAYSEHTVLKIQPLPSCIPAFVCITCAQTLAQQTLGNWNALRTGSLSVLLDQTWRVKQTPVRTGHTSIGTHNDGVLWPQKRKVLKSTTREHACVLVSIIHTSPSGKDETASVVRWLSLACVRYRL